MNIVHLGDCMEGMASKADNYFDLAVVDPPYGIGAGISKTGGASKHNSMSRLKHNTKIYNDIKPDIKYFEQLFRVSKNQIIFGGNYFTDMLYPSRCYLIWDKMNFLPSMSQIELAWTSFNEHSRLVKINSNQDDRFHISQKPVALYDWIFKNYAKPGMKILDTHVGSGSSRIAADKAGLSFEGWELDPDYHAAQEKRYKLFKQQLRLPYSIDL